MSPADVVRASYAAFDAGDLDGALAPFAPEVEWHQAQGLPHGGVYHGITAVREAVFDPIAREWWSSFTAEPETLLEAGGEVVALGRYRGVARATGRVLDVPFAHVWTFEGGRDVRFRQYVDTQGWNDALSTG
jgi:ketosteroid isomerase-like protein